MKSLLLHCKEFGAEFDSFADRPKGIEPENLTEQKWKSSKCLVVLITVEKGDDIENISIKLAKEIKDTLNDFGEKNIILAPFAHLSSNLENFEESKNFFDLLEKELNNFSVTRIHFGSHKSLLLDIFGHVGNVRFREF